MGQPGREAGEEPQQPLSLPGSQRSGWAFCEPTHLKPPPGCSEVRDGYPIRLGMVLSTPTILVGIGCSIPAGVFQPLLASS